MIMIQFRHTKSLSPSRLMHAGAWTTGTDNRLKKPADMLLDKHKGPLQPSTLLPPRCSFKTLSDTPVKLRVVVPHQPKNSEQSFLNQRRNVEHMVTQFPEDMVNFSTSKSDNPAEPAEDSPPIKAKEEEGFFSPYMKALKNWFTPEDKSESNAESEESNEPNKSEKPKKSVDD